MRVQNGNFFCSDGKLIPSSVKFSATRDGEPAATFLFHVGASPLIVRVNLYGGELVAKLRGSHGDDVMVVGELMERDLSRVEEELTKAGCDLTKIDKETMKILRTRAEVRAFNLYLMEGANYGD